MESGKRGVERFFKAKKSEPSETGAAPVSPKKAMRPTRRGFLQGVIGLAAGVAMEKESFAKQKKKEKTKELTPREWDEKLDDPWQECARELEDFNKKYYQASSQILEPLLKKYSSSDRAKEIIAARQLRQKNEDDLPDLVGADLTTIDLPAILSPEDQALVHDHFQKEFGDQVKDLFEKIKRKFKKIAATQDVWQWADADGEKVEFASAEYLRRFGAREQKLWKKITTPKRGDIFILPDAHKALSTLAPLKKSLNSYIRGVGESLNYFGSYGMVYRFLSELSHDLHANMRDEKGNLRIKDKVYEREYDEYRQFFTVYSSDYLPSSDEILPEHIDPFFSFAKKGYSGAKENILKSKWASDGYQSKFKKLLDEPTIRQRLQSEHNLPLAGVFSLVKAVIEYQEAAPLHFDDAKVLDRLLKERKKFAEQKLIDPQTDVLRFYGFDDSQEKGKNQFSPVLLDEVLSSVGVPKDKNHLFETESDPNAYKHFLDGIGKSRGKTFVFAFTHGSENAWYTRGSEAFSVEMISFELANRIVGVLRESGVEAARRTLGEMAVASQACEPYVFLYEKILPGLEKYMQHAKKNHENLLTWSSSPDFGQKIKHVYGKEKLTPEELKNLSRLSEIDVESIDLPRVIGNGQKGNIVYSKFVLEAIVRRKQGIVDHHALRGEDYLSAETEMYPQGGDMTFSSYEKGRLFPISEIRRPGKPAVPEKERDFA